MFMYLLRKVIFLCLKNLKHSFNLSKSLLNAIAPNAYENKCAYKADYLSFYFKPDILMSFGVGGLIRK